MSSMNTKLFLVLIEVTNAEQMKYLSHVQYRQWKWCHSLTGRCRKYCKMIKIHTVLFLILIIHMKQTAL